MMSRVFHFFLVQTLAIKGLTENINIYLFFKYNKIT
jgi:hypothetical protein